MIQINLLPYRPAQRQRKLQTLLVIWGCTAFVGLLFLIAVDSTILDEIHLLQTVQNRHKQTIEGLDAKLGEIKDINTRRTLVLARLAVIHRLSNERTLPVHIFEELIQSIPDQAWLTNITSQQERLNVRGLAMSSAIVAEFMRQLGRSAYFSNVELSQVVQQIVKKGGKIQSFALNLHFAIPKTGDGDILSTDVPGPLNSTVAPPQDSSPKEP